MNQPKILNNLNYLKKVSLGTNNNILLSFGDVPNFKNQDFPGFLEEAKDYLEVIDVKL